MHARYSKYLKEINLIGDVLFLNAAFLIIYLLGFNTLSTIVKSRYFDLELYFNISWIVSAYILKVHDNSRTLLFEKVIKRLLNALGLYLLFIFAFLGIKSGAINKFFVFQAYLATSFAVVSFNIGLLIFLKYYRRIGYNYRKVIIAGYGELSTELRKFFTFHPEHGYKFLGYFDDNFTSPIIRGKIGQIKKTAIEKEIDEIYCLLPYMDPKQVRDLINFGEDNFIKVRVVPDFRGFPFKGVEVQLYDFIPVLDFRPIPLDDSVNNVFKFVFDFIFSLLAIVFVLSWAFPIIAILIKLDSKGPVIFKQKRSGKNNQPFTCYKFRTMKINVDSDKMQAKKGDARITKFGAFLRRMNLDELPQFFNVLRGDMSVVGPRPHMLKHTEEFSKAVDKFMIRHSIKPGITGLAQAKGYRGETNTELKLKNRVKLDRFYVENWSLLFDFKIIMMTVSAMFKGDENAY